MAAVRSRHLWVCVCTWRHAALGELMAARLNTIFSLMCSAGRSELSHGTASRAEPGLPHLRGTASLGAPPASQPLAKHLPGPRRGPGLLQHCWGLLGHASQSWWGLRGERNAELPRWGVLQQSLIADVTSSFCPDAAAQELWSLLPAFWRWSRNHNLQGFLVVFFFWTEALPPHTLPLPQVVFTQN